MRGRKKKMKRVVSILMICLVLVGLLAGCSSKPSAFTATMEADGEKTEMVVEGKGDKVEKITQTTTIDIAEFGEAEREALEGPLEDAKAEMQSQLAGIEGVTHTIEVVGDDIVEIMTIDATNSESLDKLSTSGILPLEGETSKLSMKQSKDGLQSGGFTITEATE